MAVDRCNTKRTRVRQVLAKIEEVCGVAEVMDENSSIIRTLVSPEFQVSSEMNELETSRKTFSRLPTIPGIKTASITFQNSLAGSGDVAVPPEVDTYFKGCLMDRKDLLHCEVTDVSEPELIMFGLTLSQETTEAKGRVFAFYPPIGSNPGELFILKTTTDDFDASEFTIYDKDGITPVSTAMPSLAPVPGGFAYHPTTEKSSTLTIACEQDGITKIMKGACGTWSFSAESSTFATLDFEFQGAKGDFFDAEMTDIPVHSTIPPILQDAGLVYNKNTGEEYVPVFRTAGIDIANEVVIRENANDVSGLISAMVNGRAPVGNISQESTDIANFNLYEKFYDGALLSYQFKLGNKKGNRITFVCPEGQFESISGADFDGIAGEDLTIRLNSQIGDEDFYIIYT